MIHEIGKTTKQTKIDMKMHSREREWCLCTGTRPSSLLSKGNKKIECNKRRLKRKCMR